jgi:nucleoside-triphosphatase
VLSCLVTRKYGVDLGGRRIIKKTAINSAIDNCDLIVIDEIGKMELFSEKFQKVVEKGLNSSKPVVGTMGMINHPFVRLLKSRSGLKVLTLNRANMEYVYQEICKLLGLRII